MFERLTEKDREFVKSQVDFGYYASEIEVVRDAIRRLREQTQHYKLEKLRAMALVGHAQLQNGQGEVLDQELMDQIASDAKQQVQNQTPIKSDVKP